MGVKERPRFDHAGAMGIVAIAFSLLLLSGYAWDLTARAAKGLLDIASIGSIYADSISTLYVRLLDGTTVGFKVLIECSGLISVAIFSFICVFTIGLIGGSLRTKIPWFVLGICVGIIWNVVRLAFVIGVAYSFGAGAFFLVHYILSPTIDFIWIVSMWALIMSRLGTPLRGVKRP